MIKTLKTYFSTCTESTKVTSQSRMIRCIETIRSFVYNILTSEIRRTMNEKTSSFSYVRDNLTKAFPISAQIKDIISSMYTKIDVFKNTDTFSNKKVSIISNSYSFFLLHCVDTLQN